MKNNNVELVYGYQECEDGTIYHAFEAMDPALPQDSEYVCKLLSELLDTTPEDTRFNWNSMLIRIPESLIERIRAEEREKVLAEVNSEFDARIQNITETVDFRRSQYEESVKVMMSVKKEKIDISSLLTSGGLDALVNQAKRDLIRLKTAEAESEVAVALKKYVVNRIQK